MTEILFDRLAYLDRLKRAGISDEHARAHVEALDQALRETAGIEDPARSRTPFKTTMTTPSAVSIMLAICIAFDVLLIALLLGVGR
jgi:hypothetical protein